MVLYPWSLILLFRASGRANTLKVRPTKPLYGIVNGFDPFRNSRQPLFFRRGDLGEE